MIRTEILENNLVSTYSDMNTYIERDGVKYIEAVDPIDTFRNYTETLELIEEQ